MFDLVVFSLCRPLYRGPGGPQEAPDMKNKLTPPPEPPRALIPIEKSITDSFWKLAQGDPEKFYESINQALREWLVGQSC